MKKKKKDVVQPKLVVLEDDRDYLDPTECSHQDHIDKRQ